MARPPLLALLIIGSAGCTVTNAAPQGQGAAEPPSRRAGVECDPDNGGLALPEGFCAVVVARDIGAARHVAVAENGDVFVATGGRIGGGVVALRDTTGDGRADVQRRFGGASGNGIALHDGFLWFAPNDRVLRWPWRPGQLEPAGEPEVVVRGLPDESSHRAKSIAFGPGGALFVHVGSPSNSCQERGGGEAAPGKDPCDELATRAGVWRFDSNRLGQTQADGRRWATGMRNAVALTAHPVTGELWAAIHGRDQLVHWGMSDRDNAEKPAEEFGPVPEGADYGWPYCYYDPDLQRKVEAPEYGGDGSRIGRCADKTAPAIAFPAHWAPNGTLFYEGAMFGEDYRGGLFVAFHGSWNRAPLPQAGYRVVFVPFRDGKPAGRWRDFATGRGGPTSIRPVGLATGPDGSLYLTADREQTVWRIVRR
ncbi:MAG TPA: PQQ-dependent sugar dehydrogenase [Gemmatimonadales bacterium]|nr:PQQ-dependent sugar dehydrogenase [Gemmatimonadales bacterium]